MRPEGGSPTPTSPPGLRQSPDQLSAPQGSMRSQHPLPEPQFPHEPHSKTVGRRGEEADDRVFCFARGYSRLLSESQELLGSSLGLMPPSPNPPQPKQAIHLAKL